MTPPDSSLYLGIDTGGTFTDGVLLDPLTRQVVQSAKVLTTHHDLRICIANVLDALLPPGSRRVALASLSTTLATNAIAEGKHRPTALFLLGYDPELVYKFEFDRQFGSDPFFFIQGRHNVEGREQVPLDEVGLLEKVRQVAEKVEAFAVSSYAGSRNPSHEERASQLISQLTDKPVVQGHHLTSNFDSIRRATTARLNASLLSTTYDFLHTVQGMLRQKGLDCPLYVVRGDGTLVSAEFAAHRPVEIIHSGPATSAIGGQYLSGVDSALVVDIGGTTTDLSIIDHGHTLLEDGEATVGEYRTSVRTIRARSFGIGGDSQIRFDPRHNLTIGPGRVVPLSYLAWAYPECRKDLLAWLAAPPAIWYPERIEYWILQRSLDEAIPKGGRTLLNDPRVHRALELLQAGPARLSWLLKQVGAVSPVQLDSALLVRQEVILRAGLTPTDLLHVTGEYAPWDAEIARRVVEAVARMWDVSIEDFIAQARRWITRRIIAEILHFFSGALLPSRGHHLGRKDLANFLFDENLSPGDPYLGCQLQLKVPIVGIGAPARSFIPPVAQALNTRAIFPEHFEVANAVGTVVGNVLVRQEAEVMPWVDGAVQRGYYARAANQQVGFATLAEALDYARRTISDLALSEASAAGAHQPFLQVEERALLGETHVLVASAAGKPGNEG